MIPRLRPPFHLGDLVKCMVAGGKDSEELFERGFAEKFGFPYGLFFPYGRSGLYTLLRVLGWQDEEVLVPGYTCVVVPHAIVLSGNRVRYVDCEKDHFNVASNRFDSSLDSSLKMVIPTPLFGYPVDRDGYDVSLANKSPGVFVLYDVAHAFGVADGKGLQFDHADAALFGLGIGKILSTFYGGMLLLRSRELYSEVKRNRDSTFHSYGIGRSIDKWIYGFSTWAAFREPLFSFVDFLEHRTKLLHSFTEYYYGKSGPVLPEDVCVRQQTVQSRIGLLQLNTYRKIVEHRRRMSFLYEERLCDAGFILFSYRCQPTFSHFPLLVGDRKPVMEAMKKRGVQLGCLIDYACPDLPGYELSRGSCPNAARIAQHIINLPNWYGMSKKQVHQVCDALIQCRDRNPAAFQTGS